ncbi:hypothetical protein [Luteibacter sp. 3190]|uniref:hypothetical protein n=1 Tax=Luteibacter sp. 3190 TaxID=2817736 RepID=UPI002866A74A|nr:hypothetical protein [Luteibacter sp. 3190]MDR6935678.1 hypothetical protein [Luteibacter sp. 3190]
MIAVGLCAVASAASGAETTWATVTISSSRDFSPSPGWEKGGRPGHWVYTRDVVKTVPAEGREYPPVVVTQGAAAVDVRPFSDALTSHSSPCEAVQIDRRDVTCAYRSGYLVLTKSTELLHIDTVFGRRESDWIARQLRRDRAEFSRELGEKADPVVLVYLLPWAEGACGTLGGVREGLMLLGISRACVDKEHRPELSHFLAHETFHLWNYIVAPRAGTDPWAMMVLEGGAEWAADLVTSGGQSDQPLATSLADRIFSCASSLAGDTRSAYAIVKAQPSIAYNCGAVYVFEKSIVTFGESNARSRFFSWTRAEVTSAAASSKPAREPTGVASEGAVEATYRGTGNWLDATAAWMSAHGVRVRLDGPPTLSQARRMNIDIVRDVLKNDCAGRYGLYTDGIPRIDPVLKGCRTMSVGGQPVSLNGESLQANPVGAAEAWASACKKGEAVTVRYLDGRQESKPRCSKNGLVPIRTVGIVL